MRVSPMDRISAVIQPDNTLVFRGVKYHSGHFEGHAGERALWDGQSTGVTRFTIASTRQTFRVAPLGAELPPPSRLDSIALQLGMVAA